MDYLPLEPVTLVSQWRILKIKKDKLTEWSSLQGTKEVGGWKETNKREKSGKAIRSETRRQTSVEMMQTHMSKVIICWPAENLLVTMIIYNRIERTY